jgi:hypothetical protein
MSRFGQLRCANLVTLGSKATKGAMRRLLYLAGGFLLATLLGVAYVQFSAPAAVAVDVPAAKTSGGAGYLLVIAVLFSWVTAFVRMPGWLSVVLGFAIVWIGLAVMAVTGIFVYLQYPNNTLNDPAYVGFLGSIAMVASRAAAVLRRMEREGGA